MRVREGVNLVGHSEKEAQRARVGAAAARVERARQRRLELNKDREAKEARVDAAVADVYAAQEERDAAAALIEQADLSIGAAIVRILAEGVAISQVAELTGLSVNQAQRLKTAVSSRETTAGGVDMAAGGKAASAADEVAVASPRAIAS